MKILHVIAGADPEGGGPIEGVHRSAEVWARHGHVTHILSLDPADTDLVARSPFELIPIGLPASGRRPLLMRPLARYGYTPRMVAWLREHGTDYDAVVVNGLWNYSSVGTWRALRTSRVPYFVFTHGMLDPWFQQAYPAKARLKRVYWALLERKVLRDARAVLFTTQEEMLLARGSFRPYSCRERVVGYGTVAPGGDPDAQVAAFHAACPALAGRRFLLFLGRLHPKKGPDLMIDAFARLAGRRPDIDLVMAGPDQIGWRADLMRRAERAGIGDRVHWPGMVEGAVKWGAFRAAFTFVLPSHQENFGVVVAEALACGTPVLLTTKVNTWREVAAAGAGLAVPDDLDGVAGGLDRMLSLPAADMDAMRAATRRCFAENYDLERVALDLLRVLGE